MKTSSFVLTVALAATTLLVGCGDASNAPPAAVMAPRPAVTPSAPPSTKEEKIAAVKRSSLPEDQKKKAIDQINAGSL